MTNQQNDPAEEVRELRRRVEALEEELKARDAFIVAAAHELRNPISPLVLHVERLLNAARTSQDGAVSSAWLTEQLGSFSVRLTRFLSALNRMLDVTQIRGGRMTLVPEEVDLAELVREVVASFERELRASTSTLDFARDGPLIGLWDRMRLEQIVANLVSNAIRYGAAKPIRVELRGTPEQAVLVVSDQGVGIHEQDHRRIFERFERANARGPGGFGVGLWIVQKLCHAMGGEVSVSSCPGAGATFTVTLPREGRRER